MIPILVTGAQGYLGRHVMAAALSHGLPVIGVGRGDGVERRCDLTDAAAVAELMAETRAETIIHCAAEVPTSREAYSDGALGERNLSMVHNLLAAGPGRFVFISSMTVYPSDLGRPARVADACVTTNGYAASKLRSEGELASADGITGIVLRLPGLFGSRAGGVLYAAARALTTGAELRLDPVLPHWAAIHVEDAAEMIIRAATMADPQGAVVNIGYPGPISIPRAIRRLAQLAGIEPPDLPAAPVFEFELSEQNRLLGPPPGHLDDRLAQLLEEVRMEVAA